MCKTATKSNSAFTLVEILVAAAVFSIFLTSLFSLYRIGSRMYLTGAWKLQKQKDVERFLNVFREKIEQGSSPVEVLADGSVSQGVGQFVMVSPGTYTFRVGMPDSNTMANTTLLVAFPLCKPALRGNPGLIMYNMLRARKNPDFPDLMTLEFLSTNSINVGPGQDFVTGYAFEFFPTAPDLTRFNGNPQTFNVPTVNTSMGEILSVSISIPPMPASLVASDSLLRFDFEFEHPKYPATTVTHSMTTSVEISVNQGGL